MTPWPQVAGHFGEDITALTGPAQGDGAHAIPLRADRIRLRVLPNGTFTQDMLQEVARLLP